MIGLIGDDSMLATPSMRRRLGMDDEEVDSDAFGPGQEYMVVFCLLGVSYMFLALAIIVDEFFVPALEAIADEWELSPDIAGATLMAAGGSAPELFTSLIGTFKKSDVGFGTIVGSVSCVHSTSEVLFDHSDFVSFFAVVYATPRRFSTSSL
jgi:hypothetical protein